MDAPQAVSANLALAPGLALAFAAGLLLGLLHFATLGAAVARYTGGHVAVGLALHVVRMVILVAALYGLARMGPGLCWRGRPGCLWGVRSSCGGR
jgi:hypothetical protein